MITSSDEKLLRREKLHAGIFAVPVIALVISLPLHYLYGLDTLGHLGPIYLDVVLLIVGTAMSYNALKA